MHNRALWILQWIFGVYFVAIGLVHLVLPEGLPTQLSWMYDLSDNLHLISGIAEILGGLGLILPSVTRIRPVLTPLAALGLVIVMLGAIGWHIGRDEMLNIGINVLNIIVLAYIGYGRWKLAPIEPRVTGDDSVR